MGFDVNPLNNKPIIREAANMQNDGGTGNLGYFENEGGQKKKKDPDSIFSNDKDAEDAFVHESDKDITIEEDFSIAKFIAQIIFNIKSFFKKLF